MPEKWKTCPKCGGAEKNKHGACKQCIREADRRRYHQAPEKKKELARLWSRKNPDKVREHSRKMREENRERDRGYKSRWKQSNPDKTKADGHRRRARIKGNGGSYTAAEWKALVRDQNGRCLACGKEEKLTVDHVIPLDKGGSNDISNIQGLCRSCNAKKGTRVTDYRKNGSIMRWIQKKLF